MPLDPRGILGRHLPNAITTATPTGAPQPRFDSPGRPTLPEDFDQRPDRRAADEERRAPLWPTYDDRTQERHRVYPDRGGPTREDEEVIGRDIEDLGNEDTDHDPGGWGADLGPGRPVIEICAWYQPFHVFQDWGIFVKAECVQALFPSIRKVVRAELMKTRGASSLGPKDLARTNIVALRLAFSRYYLHEVFHHETEAIATRVEMVVRQPIYLPGTQGLYSAGAGDPEEPLAEAYAIATLGSSDHMSWRGFDSVLADAQSVRRAVREHVRRLVATATPWPYSRGATISKHQAAARSFHEAVLSAALGASGWWKSASPEIWQLGTHMVRGYRHQDHVGFWLVVPKGRRAPIWLRLLSYPWK